MKREDELMLVQVVEMMRTMKYDMMSSGWPTACSREQIFKTNSKMEKWATLGFTDGLGIGVIESAQSMRGE